MQTYILYILTTPGGRLMEKTYSAASIENLRKRLLGEYGKHTYVHIFILQKLDNGREKGVGELDKYIDPMLWRPDGRKTWYMIQPSTGRTMGPWSETEAMRYKTLMAKAGRYRHEIQGNVFQGGSPPVGQAHIHGGRQHGLPPQEDSRIIHLQDQGHGTGRGHAGRYAVLGRPYVLLRGQGVLLARRFKR